MGTLGSCTEGERRLEVSIVWRLRHEWEPLSRAALEDEVGLQARGQKRLFARARLSLAGNGGMQRSELGIDGEGGAKAVKSKHETYGAVRGHEHANLVPHGFACRCLQGGRSCCCPCSVPWYTRSDPRHLLGATTPSQPPAPDTRPGRRPAPAQPPTPAPPPASLATSSAATAAGAGGTTASAPRSAPPAAARAPRGCAAPRPPATTGARGGRCTGTGPGPRGPARTATASSAGGAARAHSPGPAPGPGAPCRSSPGAHRSGRRGRSSTSARTPRRRAPTGTAPR